MQMCPRVLAPFAALTLLISACGGDDPRPDGGGFINQDATIRTDSGIHPDATVTPDTGVEDTGTPDSGVEDTGAVDTGVVDTGVADTGTPDTGVLDTGVVDGGPVVTTSMQILLVRAQNGVVSPALPVQGGWVTYVRPAIGDDPAGFFVQADVMGPALFVAVDPTTLTPAPAVGDVVSFDVDETELAVGQHRTLAISNFSVTANGQNVSTLVQDLSAATDVVSALDAYDNELLSIAGTLTGAYRFAGNGHQRIQLATAGLPTEPNLSFRAPDGLIASLGLLPGCDIQITATPMWRFNSNAQVSAWSAADISVVACAAPVELLGAEATASTTVELTFNRPMDAVSAVAGQFTLQPAAAVQSVAVTGNVITLTTATLADLTSYTVTVGAAVTDDLGNPVDPNADTATFVSPGNAAVPAAGGDVVITEILQAPFTPTDREWFEVYNPGTVAMNLNGCVVSDDGSNTFTISSNLYVMPGSYTTLARVADPGFVPDYVWPSFTLANGDDEVVITCGMVEIDRVNYDGGPIFPDPANRSMSLDPASTSSVANDDGRNWCFGQADFGGGLGSPGSVNPACTNNPANTSRPNAAGQLVVSEIFYDAGANDDGKEWFEIYNPSTSISYNLYGCELGDNFGADTVVREDFVIGPMSYATVGTSTEGIGSHGFTVDLMLRTSEISLGDSGDAMIIVCDGTTIDGVDYSAAGFPSAVNAALNLDPASLSDTANDVGGNWCAATMLYDGTNAGSPGAANETCPVNPPDAGVIDSGAMDTGVTPDSGVDGGTPVDGGGPTGGGLVINEVDYDQPGSDTMEFVEIYNSSNAAIDLTNVAVVTVNGNGGSEYGRYALSGSLAAGEYLVVGNSAVVVPTGVTFITLPSNGMQNGAPDGVALIDTVNNTLIDALSYEGSITAATITGFAGPVSLVEGTAATAGDFGPQSLSRLPNGQDTNDADADFTASATPTPGAANQP